MHQYIKINDDNSIQLLGKELFNDTVEYDVLYTGQIPDGFFLKWNPENNTIEEDFEKRRSLELSNIRNARDQLLQETDWVIIKSLESGGIDPEWVEYRQKLRDLPSQYSLTGLIDFPELPASGGYSQFNIYDLQPYTLLTVSNINSNDNFDWPSQIQNIDQQWIQSFWSDNQDVTSGISGSGSGLFEPRLPSGYSGQKL